MLLRTVCDAARYHPQAREWLGLVPNMIGRKQGESLSGVRWSVTVWSRWGQLLVYHDSLELYC